MATEDTPRDNSDKPLAHAIGDGDQTRVLEKLAGSIAHEMNNVLAAITGLASVLQADLDEDSRSRSDVDGILAACHRGLRLTRNLSTFASVTPQGDREHIDVNELVGKVRGYLQRTLPANVELTTNFAPNVARIHCNRSQFRHALVNVVMNAIEALDGGGKITLTTRNAELSGREVPTDPHLVPGRSVWIQVTDDGPGMDRATADRAFEPFFTTKANGQGLGLALVRRLIGLHGGAVSLQSKRGLGTTLTIEMPAAGRRTTRSDTPTNRSEIPFHGKALVVDDDELVLSSSMRALERMGISVLAASDGDRALEVYREHQAQISVVLLDLIMPGIDGAEVLERVKELDPDAYVIITSGYDEAVSRKRLEALGADDFLSKPYGMSQLAEALARVHLVPED